jgi:hypothetical protein
LKKTYGKGLEDIGESRGKREEKENSRKICKARKSTVKGRKKEARVLKCQPCLDSELAPRLENKGSMGSLGHAGLLFNHKGSGKRERCR